MDLLIQIGQLVLSLSLLIVLHEFGHFLPARLFGTRVEKFYLFFDPYFSLFKKQIGETEYGIGWLPLGGYVKISGMIDESFDKEQLEQEPQPWEFRSKPAWQRLIIMLGGVTVNFILGFFLFAMVLFAYGEEYLPNENVTAGIYADSLGREIGLRTGDKVLRVGDTELERFGDRHVLRAIAINGVRELTVERDGREQQLEVDNRFADVLTRRDNKYKRIYIARFPFVVDEVTEGGPGAEAGLKQGDKLLSVDGQPARYYDEYFNAVKGRNNEEIQLRFEREGRSQPLDVNLKLNEDGKMLVRPYATNHFYETATIEYNVIEAIPAGFKRGMGFIGDQLNAFAEMFRGNIKPSETLGGFGSIGSMFPTTWSWETFWNLTASLSLILAIMNLLPIPALDGGHVMFLLYEVITGNKPSDKFLERATMVGFVLVLALILYANGLDIYYWFKGKFLGG